VTLESVQSKRVHVIQGEFKVSDDPNVVLSTILGSCVAACMRDPVAGVGGMNHFLLPGQAMARVAKQPATACILMELLINGLLKKGARRERMEAKIIGGAKTIAGFSNVGEKNAEFAQQFLTDEGIRIVGSNTGGDVGRKLEYFPRERPCTPVSADPVRKCRRPWHSKQRRQKSLHRSRSTHRSSFSEEYRHHDAIAL
jgi:chemotaxis protein CheD